MRLPGLLLLLLAELLLFQCVGGFCSPLCLHNMKLYVFSVYLCPFVLYPQDSSFDVNNTTVDEVLSGASTAASAPRSSSSSSYSGYSSYSSGGASFGRPVGSPPSAGVLRVLSPLTFGCLLAGMFKTALAAATAQRVSRPVTEQQQQHQQQREH